MPARQARHPGFITRIRNLERVREISAAAARHGFGYLFERHRLLALLPWWRRQFITPDGDLGRHARELLEELGPTFVKFGQLLSTRADIVPPEILKELVKLQDHVAPLPFEEVARVIERELGASPAKLFVDFDPTPIASASIGQVHGALLPGDQAVVVKVQRPEAPRQIRKDLELLYQFAGLVEGRLEIGVSPTAIVDEFARSITRELDYLLEARNIARFAANFKGSDSVCIPNVYKNYCTARVLTMERLHGPTLNSEQVHSLPLESKKKLAEIVVDCWLKQVFEHGFVHADPHPANIVYLDEGKIGLLDFGMTGTLRLDDLEEGTRLFTYLLRADVPGVKRSLRRLGVKWPPSVDETVTDVIEEAFGRYFGVSLAEVDARALLRQVMDVIYMLHLQLPARFLVLDKALVTLEGTLEQLYPEVNLFDMAREYAHRVRIRLLNPERIMARLRRDGAQYARAVADYPFQLRELMEQLTSGELEVKYHHTGLDDLIHRLDLITNRLVVALVSIALGATGTAVGVMVEQGPHLGGISVWGLPGFAGSLVFGAWLIYAIIRSGRL
ncbi:MAG: AarF/ABC1/UbiB kinase family protein [Thermoleophilia bacterium]|nr:AarF/ABC1/UbiB kinase family protein [Thermoleophilia bacterium]